MTHLCGAPIVMSTLVNAGRVTGAASRRPWFHPGRAPPPRSALAAMADAGFEVIHLYGLTEIYGPAIINEWHEEWDR